MQGMGKELKIQGRTIGFRTKQWHKACVLALTLLSRPVAGHARIAPLQFTWGNPCPRMPCNCMGKQNICLVPLTAGAESPSTQKCA
eukprot:1158744-Pelagomonas_calceolata.AAC.11